MALAVVDDKDVVLEVVWVELVRWEDVLDSTEDTTLEDEVVVEEVDLVLRTRAAAETTIIMITIATITTTLEVAPSFLNVLELYNLFLSEGLSRTL